MSQQNYIERYWRDAKPEDAIKEPPMVARFRDDDGESIERNFRLLGWSRFDRRNSGCLWYSDGVGCYRHCQVYDAPDPGEGWRLIDIENECPQECDEFREDWQKHWQSRGEFSDTYFAPKTHYRRRIEQPKPEPKYEPFKWEDREQLRGRWITWRHENGLAIESYANHLNEHRLGGLLFRSHDAKWLVENATFLDTGEPVGKKVMQ